jgi:hypothetical protein
MGAAEEGKRERLLRLGSSVYLPSIFFDPHRGLHTKELKAWCKENKIKLYYEPGKASSVVSTWDMRFVWGASVAPEGKTSE